jgi:nitrate/TMAO reductase-like tetraheme cytochrome c subunit
MSTPPLSRNPVSILGAWITTLAAFAFLTFYALEAFALVASPYAGLVGFVAVPALFLLGLLLIPLGMWWEGRRRRRGREPWPWPAIDLGRPRTRTVVAGVLVLTLVNLAIVTVATTGALHYMETNAFCGMVCHTPMAPEFTAHPAFAHANVDCVGCHVAPGAGGALRAKMNGARQAWEFLAGSYARPIATPARNLPAAEETCARCHAVERMAPTVHRIKRSYDEDEANTETATPLEMLTRSAHWHARPDVVVEYLAADPGRETIPYVRVTEQGGGAIEYAASSAEAKPDGPWRRMDCLDCHNRPAHTMSASAEAAVDRAIAADEISASVPFVRREAVKALTVEYPSRAAALDGIRRSLDAFYRATPAPPEDVAGAIRATERLYRVNVFPDMNVTWGTYLSLLGHAENPGCFRCHDDDHKAPSGALIRQDCELCHRE